MGISQNDLVIVTRELEVTPGVVVGAARDRSYGTAPSWTPSGNTLTSGINTGDGGVKSVRAGLRSADVAFPSELVFELNDEEFEDFFRDTFAGSEATVTDGSVTFNDAGTHQDGSTGPVITAAATTFDALVTAGAEGAMMEISGAGVDPANKRPRPIKDLASDGSQIDIEPLYVTGGVGLISEPLVNEGPVTATIKCGDIIKNQGIAAIRSVNFEFDFTDQSGGSFQMVRGCKAGTFKLSFDGKGNVAVEFGYTGMDYDVNGTATQGNGTVNPNAAIDNDNMVAGEDLVYFLVGAVTAFSGDNLMSFNLDGNGNASGIDDVAGTRARTAVTVGDIDFTGSFKIYHEQVKMALASALARNGTRTPVDMKFMDPAGNFYWGRLPKALLEPGGPVPGQKGSQSDGTFNIKTQLGAGTQRTMIWQKFAAA